MDEFRLIAEIERRLAVPRVGAEVEVGIGDDAAVLAPREGRQVLSVDAAVEGVHFRLDWIEARDVGYRSLVAALSDLAAMGASPRAALCALIAPADADVEVLFGLADGLAEASAEYAAPVVGGNVARGGELSLTCTVVGVCDGPPLLRSGARPDDSLYVTGALGEAALGVHALDADLRGGAFDRAIARYRRPAARVALGRQLVGRAHAAIDLSDGLGQDLDHVCEASGVGAVLELDLIPLSAELKQGALELGLDPLALALGGGEDYELLFAADRSCLDGARRVGRVVEGRGVRLVDARGCELPLPAVTGFRHF